MLLTTLLFIVIMLAILVATFYGGYRFFEHISASSHTDIRELVGAIGSVSVPIREGMEGQVLVPEGQALVLGPCLWI